MCVVWWLQLLERAHGEQARDWALLRVAIVELRDNVFIGRLFFGESSHIIMHEAIATEAGAHSSRTACKLLIHMYALCSGMQFSQVPTVSLVLRVCACVQRRAKLKEELGLGDNWGLSDGE